MDNLSRDMYRIECTIVFILFTVKKNDLVDTVRLRAAGDHPLICEAVLIHFISFLLQNIATLKSKRKPLNCIQSLNSFYVVGATIMGPFK